MPVLVSLLEDPEPEVQASAAGALMFATVTPQGERQRQFSGIPSANPTLRQLSDKTLPLLLPQVL